MRIACDDNDLTLGFERLAADQNQAETEQQR
jgi:hypothetical protein